MILDSAVVYVPCTVLRKLWRSVSCIGQYLPLTLALLYLLAGEDLQAAAALMTFARPPQHRCYGPFIMKK